MALGLLLSLIVGIELTLGMYIWKKSRFGPRVMTFYLMVLLEILLFVTPCLTSQKHLSREYLELICWSQIFGAIFITSSRLVSIWVERKFSLKFRTLQLESINWHRLQLILLILTVLSLFLSASAGTLYARIGSENAAVVASQLPVWILFLIRFQGFISVPVIVLWLRKKSEIMSQTGYASVNFQMNLIIICTLIIAFINSRQLFVLFVVIFFSSSYEGYLFRFKGKLALGGLGVAIIMSFFYINSIRYTPPIDWVEAPSTAIYNTGRNMFSVPISGFDGASADICLRTDGIYAAAVVRANGELMYFEKIYFPFLFLFPWLDEVKEIKYRGLTGFKNLADDKFHIAPLGALDFPNSVILEPVARFGVIGIIIFGVVYGTIWGIGTGLWASDSNSHIMFSVAFLFPALVPEHSVIEMMIKTAWTIFFIAMIALFLKMFNRILPPTVIYRNQKGNTL